jgi:hypothetical protein
MDIELAAVERLLDDQNCSVRPNIVSQSSSRPNTTGGRRIRQRRSKIVSKKYVFIVLILNNIDLIRIYH